MVKGFVLLEILNHMIIIGNYTVLEVLMKNHTHVWRNVYNIIINISRGIINISPNTSEIFY